MKIGTALKLEQFQIWKSQNYLENNFQVHGDGAYVGQGVNQESLVLSGVPHFEIGGTIHLMVNNQVAFTTPPSQGRSTRYCTDLAKFISAPVIHVNGDDPEVKCLGTVARASWDLKQLWLTDQEQ